MRDFWKRKETGPEPVRRLSVRDVSLAAPHPVFDLRADLIAAGAGLEAARLTGWRYLVAGPERAVAAAEIAIEENGSGGRRTSSASHINTGPFVAAFEDAIQLAESLPDVKEGSFELRLLRISALLLMVLWLKSDEGGEDILVPLDPAPSVLRAGIPCASALFLSLIRPLAVKKAAEILHR